MVNFPQCGFLKCKTRGHRAIYFLLVNRYILTGGFDDYLGTNYVATVKGKFSYSSMASSSATEITTLRLNSVQLQWRRYEIQVNMIFIDLPCSSSSLIHKEM